MLLVFLALVFATGGGSRDDVASLAVLRPVAILLLGYGLIGLTRDRLRAHAALFAIAGAWIALHVIQLIPLPPALWQMLPGRELVAAIDAEAGLGAVWRPIAMVPGGAWNALASLCVPMAVLVVGVQLSRAQQRQLILPLLAFAVISALFGLMQLASDPRGPLYLYRITNSGAAVGLFANRNHQAILLGLCFPLLALFASSNAIGGKIGVSLRHWVAAAIAIFFVPLILVTGSRAGLIVGAIGIGAAWWLYQPGRTRQPRRTHTGWRPFALGAAVVASIAVTIAASRAEALRRLFSTEGEQSRTEIWAQSLAMIGEYAPLGSGFGSFAETYRIFEPTASLLPSYVNHAHNDWLELVITGGIPAALIAVTGLAWLVVAALRAHRERASFARAGAVTLGLLLLASLGDYPLRVPALAAIAAVAMLWLAGSGNGERQKGLEVTPRFV